MIYFLAFSVVVIGAFAYLGVKATNDIINYHNHRRINDRSRKDNRE